MPKLKFYIITFFALYSLVAAQKYNFKYYTIEHGLSLSQISYAFQSKSAHLYIGTYGGGLSKFDGLKFQNYNSKNGLAGNSIYAILEDRSGNIWIGTNNGLSVFNGINFKNYFTQNGLPGNEINCLTIVDENKLLIGTSKGLCYLDIATEKITQIDLPQKGTNIISFNAESLNDMLIGTDIGLYHVSGKTVNQKISQYINSTYRINKITKDRKGIYWIASNKGLFKFVGNHVIKYTKDNGLMDDEVLWLTEDREGKFWIATDKGLNLFDGKSFKNITSKNGFADFKVWHILEDRENNLWFSTDIGLYVLKHKEFKIYDRVKNKIIAPWAINKDDNNNIIIGTENQNILKISNNEVSENKLANLTESSVWAILRDSRNRTWFGSDYGLVRHSKGSYKIYNDLNGYISKETTFSIFEDHSKKLWFGTEFGKVFRFDGFNFQEIENKTGNENFSIYSITQDKNNDIWIGTERGIAKYENNSFIIPTEFDWLRKFAVLKVIAKGSKLIIGTYEIGVVIYDLNTSQFDIVDDSKGLNDDAVLLMIFDNQNYLWIGTNKGLNKFDYIDYLENHNFKIIAFDKFDGIPGLECAQNAVYKDESGHLWFGTVGGVVTVDPAKVKPVYLEPKVSLSDVKILKQNPEVEFKSVLKNVLSRNIYNIEIPYENNSLTIDFIGINLANPQSVKYRYRFLNSHWSPVISKNSVSYSNLSPGNYTFQVISCNKNGIWNYEPSNVNFTIVAPFYRTYWFYGISGILIFLIVYVIYRFRITAVTKKNKELEERIKFRLKYEQELEKSERELLKAKERAERSDKLKSEFLAQMSHEIRTPINSILNFTNLLKNEVAEKVSDELSEGFSIIESGSRRLIRTIDSILNMSQIQTNSFETFPSEIDLWDILSNLMAEFKTAAAKKNLELRFEKNCNKKLYADEYTVTQLFANLIDNAIKYTNKGTVTIKISDCIENKITVTVCDTGLGISEEFQKKIFEPFSQEETGYTRKFEGTGLGLALVKKYCELNKATLTCESVKEKGTTFTVTFDLQS